MIEIYCPDPEILAKYNDKPFKFSPQFFQKSSYKIPSPKQIDSRVQVPPEELSIRERNPEEAEQLLQGGKASKTDKRKGDGKISKRRSSHVSAHSEQEHEKFDL